MRHLHAPRTLLNLGVGFALATWTTASALRAELPSLPEAVTSFGAVTCDGYLYVFGGHRGERHDYSARTVSGSFHRLSLEPGATWETLPPAAPGQGQPLVAHAGRILRVGGMAARNAEGASQSLFSSALVQRYDPSRGLWEDLPPLPQPRSSHDAVVLHHTLYVVGGWSVSGRTADALWFTNALALDLHQPASGWREIPQPFQRRALALAALGSRVVCIGGMDSDNSPTLAVEFLDTTNNRWSRGPDLPEGKHQGFACSAITHQDRVYVSAFQGDLLRLSRDEAAWEIVGRLAHPRMAHRLVTARANQLIALGGDDSEGKLPDLELLTPMETAAAGSPPAPTASLSPTAHANP